MTTLPLSQSATHAWHIFGITIPPKQANTSFYCLNGTFDTNSIAQIVYIHDNLPEIASAGMHTIHHVSDQVNDHVKRSIAQRATAPSYRRGLTFLIHGGLGRGFTMDLPSPPKNWHYLPLPISDFNRIAWTSELNALRSWRLLQQEHDLLTQDITTFNLGGFLNYYEYRRSMDFHLLPTDDRAEAMPTGVWLLTDYLAPIRHRLRRQIARHMALAPDQHSWVEVQRESADSFFPEDSEKSVFVSTSHLAHNQLLGCTDTPCRAWWVSCAELPITRQKRELVYHVWHMALQWMHSLAIQLEDRIPNLPPGPITIALEFPRINNFQPEYTDATRESHPPTIHASNTTVIIQCTPDYLYNFMKAENIADRLMVSAIFRGIYNLAGLESPDDAVVNEFLQSLLSHEHASYFRMLPAHTPSDLVARETDAPEPRFVAPENRAWCSMNLASRSGWTGTAGTIPLNHAAPLLNQSVDVLWADLKARLKTLSRKNVITRALTNLEAIERDRHQWRTSAGALTGIHTDQDKVVEVASKRENQRSLAGIASRVIVEMAVCACPEESGLCCTDTDLDLLVAAVATLLECAIQSDALRYGLSVSQPIVDSTGSFRVDFASTDILPRYYTAHGEHEFQEYVDRYKLAFHTPDSDGNIDLGFDAAFGAEFGLSLQQYYDAIQSFAEEAIDRGSPVIRLPKHDVLRHFEEVGVERPLDTYAMFALQPRAIWDDPSPQNAEQRDWYPWRYKRRLSLIRRPFVQLSTAAESDVLIMPTLLENSFQYLYEAFDGRLPIRLFDSPEMKSWIGTAVDRDGHEFNRQVAKHLRSLDWETQPELKMTELGGGADLGDIDVLVWRRDSGVVYAIECKRLFTDRTVGEIGERLAEYSVVPGADNKTPLQRHIDRLVYLRANIQAVARFTSMPSQSIRLSSALVTDQITPMQFSSEVSRELDVVTDYENIEVHFSQE